MYTPTAAAVFDPEPPLDVYIAQDRAIEHPKRDSVGGLLYINEIL